jgi:hypothetical protein
LLLKSLIFEDILPDLHLVECPQALIAADATQLPSDSPLCLWSLRPHTGGVSHEKMAGLTSKNGDSTNKKVDLSNENNDLSRFKEQK